MSTESKTNFGRCRLCGLEGPLCDSHMTPKFFGKWLKDTSATGFLRSASNPNVLRQDVYHLPFLCQDCEAIFGVVESEFKNKIFDPYVSEVLERDLYGRVTRVFHYDGWLLKFVISIQWRLLVDPHQEWPKEPSEKQKKLMKELEVVWGDYLLGKRKDSGSQESYMLFLCAAPIEREEAHILPDVMNLYLVRGIDAFIFFGKSQGYLYTKLGPILLISAIFPSRLMGLNKMRLKMRGTISTVFENRNPEIGHHLLIGRPKFLSQMTQVSEVQRKKFWDKVEKNPKRYLDSMTLRAQIADQRKF